MTCSTTHLKVAPQGAFQEISHLGVQLICVLAVCTYLINLRNTVTICEGQQF